MSALPPESEPDYYCPACKDTRFIRRAVPLTDPDFGRAMRCPVCAPRDEKAIGIPRELVGKHFGHFDLQKNPSMKAAMDRCVKVAKGEAWCALLMGNPGLGKSLLGACALDLSGHTTPGYFWEFGALLKHLRFLAFDDAGPRYPEDVVLKGWQEGTFLLVLDDVGAEKMTEWAAATLYTILNARYQAKLPTIITTNNPDAIDERILSRYYEGAVACKGVDLRRAR